MGTTGATAAAVLAGSLGPQRTRLLAEVRGRSLHLRPGDPVPPDAGPRPDTIVSEVWLASQADLPAAVRRLADLLAPGGRLLVLEPERALGWRGLAGFLTVGSAGSHLDRQHLDRLHLDRDVSGALWSAGLRVVDADHRVAAGASRPLRHWLLAVACHPPTAPYAATAPQEPS
jgi:hypothetical protein